MSPAEAPPAARRRPLIDDWPVVLLGLALEHAGDTFRLGRWWKKQPIVARNRWLI